MQICTWSSRLNFGFIPRRNEKELPLVRLVVEAASVDCAPTAPASATSASNSGNSFAELARLRTDPQHTRPALPLLRSRPGGVHAASVVRSPKSDKLSNSSDASQRSSNCPTLPVNFNSPTGALANAHHVPLKPMLMRR